MDAGPFPGDDGWGWLYRFYVRTIEPRPGLRRLARGYLAPSRLERWGGGRLYRLLGVHLFGRIIPTGGVAIRRLTRLRMAPYTLRGPSLAAARAFLYRACAFELAHLPFMLTLLVLSAYRLHMGRADLALENLLVNALVNIYPIMHHRHTRVRIVQLLRRRARSSQEESSGVRPGHRP